jgi:hypothetical protein
MSATSDSSEDRTTDPLLDGIVTGTPRGWLRVEGATLLVASFVAYSRTGQAWWLAPLTLLVPDLTMIGYLGGPRLGSRLYNVAHSTPIPATLVAVAWWEDTSLPVALGLVWLAHIGLDRLLGYGLKYHDHFQHTHLGRLARSR